MEMAGVWSLWQIAFWPYARSGFWRYTSGWSNDIFRWWIIVDAGNINGPCRLPALDSIHQDHLQKDGHVVAQEQIQCLYFDSDATDGLTFHDATRVFR